MLTRTCSGAIGSIVSLFILGSACAGQSTLVAQGGYTVFVPVVDAPAKPIQEASFEVGVLGVGKKRNWGGTIGARVRPWSKEVGGGSLQVNLLSAVVPEGVGQSFLLSKVGLGIVGTTIVTNEERQEDPVGNTLDLMTPSAELAVGYGLHERLALSLGLSVQYLWHVWNDHKPGANPLLLGLTMGVGAFNPR